MKILFASDIHGSASACEKVLERVLMEKADRLILMVPGQFFFDLVMRIVRIVAVSAGIPLLLAVGYMIYRTWQRRALLTIRGPEGSAISREELDRKGSSEEETWHKNSRK